MDTELTDEQAELAATTRRFLSSSMPTGAVRTAAELPGGFDREWWRQCADLGWAYMIAGEPAPTGVPGLTNLVIIAEEVGRAVAPGPLVPTNVVAWALANAGTAEARTGHLDGLLDGTTVGAWAFAEAGGSWRLDDIETSATRAEGGVRLNGTKAYVEAGAEADLLLVTARSRDEIVQALVRADDAGVTVRPRQSIDLVRRFATVELDDVLVPAERVLSASGSPADDVERQLQIAVVLQCAEMVGAMNRVFDFTVEWAFDRYSFGRPLASYQALKHRFADMKMWLEASLAAASAAARSVESGGSDARELVSVAKSYIGDHAPELIQDCVQMHGGIGVTWEHDIHLYLRRVALDRMMYGEPASHRDRVASLLGL